MKIKSYRDLLMWQKSIELTVSIYSATETFPKKELFGITNQMRRAATSVSANLSEGWARGKKNSTLHFFDIAKGSLCELETFVIISGKLNYINSDQTAAFSMSITEISKMIYGMQKHLKSTQQ
jgi:four helix bundle protein